MFRLSRMKPIFTRTWFLSAVGLASLVLAAGFLATIDARTSADWTALTIEPGHLEMVVRAAGAKASTLIP